MYYLFIDLFSQLLRRELEGATIKYQMVISRSRSGVLGNASARRSLTLSKRGVDRCNLFLYLLLLLNTGCNWSTSSCYCRLQVLFDLEFSIFDLESKFRVHGKWRLCDIASLSFLFRFLVP